MQAIRPPGYNQTGNAQEFPHSNSSQRDRLVHDWLSSHPHALWWLAAFSAVSFFGTLAAIPLIVVRIRPDYFVERDPPALSWHGRHPAIRVLFHVGKTGVGVVLVMAGIVLSLPGVPGQGLLTVLIGLMLLDFPGKRRMELWLIQRKQISSAVNWIRAKAGRPPLELPMGGGEQKKQPGE